MWKKSIVIINWLNKLEKVNKSTKYFQEILKKTSKFIMKYNKNCTNKIRIAKISKTNKQTNGDVEKISNKKILHTNRIYWRLFENNRKVQEQTITKIQAIGKLIRTQFSRVSTHLLSRSFFPLARLLFK